MSESYACLLLLLLMNIAQFVFWSRQCSRLIDKIMSRNYHEYVKAEQLASSSPESQTQKTDVNLNDEQLDELNRMIGAV